MANSLYNQLNKNQLSQNNMINMLKNVKNPQQLIMNMANSNPQVATVLKEVQANGGNAKDLFYRKAKEMGIDPNSILNNLR